MASVVPGGNKSQNEVKYKFAPSMVNVVSEKFLTNFVENSVIFCYLLKIFILSRPFIDDKYFITFVNNVKKDGY